MKMKTKQALLLFIGILCLSIGFFRGEMTEVMRKAIMICLECVGLG